MPMISQDGKRYDFNPGPGGGMTASPLQPQGPMGGPSPIMDPTHVPAKSVCPICGQPMPMAAVGQPPVGQPPVGQPQGPAGAPPMGGMPPGGNPGSVLQMLQQLRSQQPPTVGTSRG